MAFKTLEHLQESVDEIKSVSGKVRTQLVYIKDDLLPLLEQGVPMQYLLRELDKLGITRRRETVRCFIKEEFPDIYDLHYQQCTRAERLEKIRRAEKQKRHSDNTISGAGAEPETLLSQPSSTSDEGREENTITTKDEGHQPPPNKPRLTADALISGLSSFQSGKHLNDDTKESDT